VTDIQSRLSRCFETVFPDLPAGQIPQARQSSMENWDSVASITLINVIEEEFQTSIDFERIPELTSFTSICEYLAASPK
jgi:acyl carrier protein